MTDISNYVERFKSMVAELEEHPDIVVETFEVAPPATEEQLERAADYHALAPGMREFYTQANGLTLKWSYVGQDLQELGDKLIAPAEHGSINILPVNETFQDHKGHIYFEGMEDYTELHPLDQFADEACSALAFDGTDNPPIHYHYLGEEQESLEVDFREYLELLLESRGYWYWPLAIAPRAYRHQRVSLEEASFRVIAPELWDDFDNGKFPSRDGRKPELEEIARLVEIGNGTADLDEYKYIQSRKEQNSSSAAPAPSMSGAGGTHATPSGGGSQKPVQSKAVMAIVCLFLGNLGVHRLMMGHKNWWWMLVTLGFCGMWSLVDLVLILTGKLRMADGRALE